MRVARGWSSRELSGRLAALEGLERGFPERSLEEMTPERGFRAERMEALVGHEPPGPPTDEGPFARAREVLAAYELSDPTIVAAHFDGRRPLEGRRMLLEIKVLGLRYLCGVVVAAVRDESDAERSVFGFRYDTLEGHIERGAEWFLVSKDHRSGEVRLRIESRWRSGELPNAPSRVGFAVLARFYRELWLRRAHQRMAALLRHPRRSLHPGTAPLVETGRDAGSLHHAPSIQPSVARLLGAAAALGALSGARSTAGVATLAVHSVSAGARPGAGPLEQLASAPEVAAVALVAAAGELAFDKVPGVPDRVAPPALAGRVGLGAASGWALARRWRHRPAARAAVVAGAAAAAGAALSLRLRRALARRMGGGAAGVVEDAFVLLGAAALHRALHRAELHRREAMLPTLGREDRPPRPGPRPTLGASPAPPPG